MRTKQTVHIYNFYFIGRRHRQKQFANVGVVAKSHRVILLHSISTYSSHGLYCFFLCNFSQVFPDIAMTELVVCAVNVVRRRNNQVQLLVLRQALYYIAILRVCTCTDLRRNNANSHHQQQFPRVVYRQQHNALNRFGINIPHKLIRFL